MGSGPEKKARYYPAIAHHVGGDIVKVRPMTGHIIQILPAQSIVAVRHVSIRADQSQNASKVDRKKPRQR